MFKTATRILSVLALMLGMAACTTIDPTADDEETGGGAQQHTQPLRILGIYQDAQIKGGETPVEQEFIKDYYLVFVNTRVADQPAVEAVQHVTLDKGVEYHVQSFPIEISETGGVDQHQYRVFAFANFDQAMTEKVEFELPGTSDGEKVPTCKLSELESKLAAAKAVDRDATITLRSSYESTLMSATMDLKALNGYDFRTGDKYVPMTGVTDYTATMEYHQPKDIPLVRMMAKLEFKIKNYLPEPIKIKSITVHPVAKAPVYLFPHVKVQTPAEEKGKVNVVELKAGDYPVNPGVTLTDDPVNKPNRELRRIIPILPEDFEVKTDTTRVVMSLGEGVEVLDPIKASEEAIKAHAPLDQYLTPTVGTVYVNESLAEWHTNNLHFAYDVEFVDNEGRTQHRYALSQDDFTSYCRNDHVIIPLVISNEYSIEPVVDFVAPIGGYPPVMQDVNGEEFYATFSGLGEFAIYPEIYKNGKRTGYTLRDESVVKSYSIEAYTHVDATHIKGTLIDNNLSAEMRSEMIYEEVPHYSRRDNAIIGSFNGKLGHSIVVISVTLTNDVVVTKRIHLINEDYKSPDSTPTSDVPTDHFAD